MSFVKLVNTCGACPSQWDAEDEEGNEYYIRYRWGHLSVDKNGVEVLSKSCGDGLDGYMSEEDMLRHTSVIFGVSSQLDGVLIDDIIDALNAYRGALDNVLYHNYTYDSLQAELSNLDRMIDRLEKLR